MDGWCVSLDSSTTHMFNLDTVYRCIVCLPPQSCSHLANPSSSRVQIKTSEIGPSRFVYLKADSSRRENKRKYWCKQKAGKPVKQLRTSECFQISKLYVSNTWRTRRITSTRSFGCAASYPIFVIIVPHTSKLASTIWHGPQLHREDESGSPDPTASPHSRACPRICHALTLAWL